jgi:siroheme synthase-like protein
MPGYPVVLELGELRPLVVGGGQVAGRKLVALLDGGGRPAVLAPALVPEVARLVAAEELAWLRRRYEEGTLAGYNPVVAATDDGAVNAAIAAEARARGALVNVVDAPELSSFTVPAVARRGEVLVAVSTGGASPLLAGRLRDRLEEWLTPGLARAVGRLAALRDDVARRWPDDEAARRRFWFELITPEFLDVARAGRDADLEARIEECLSRS